MACREPWEGYLAWLWRAAIAMTICRSERPEHVEGRSRRLLRRAQNAPLAALG